nr:PIN domain-containing protein [Oribacterium sp. KHPX15]
MAFSLMLANIEIMDFDVDATNYYGKIRADLEKKGTPIGSLDMMIEDHAQSLAYTLVTNNVREFSRVEGLKIKN